MEFLRDRDSAKRAKLIDKLLASDSFCGVIGPTIGGT